MEELKYRLTDEWIMFDGKKLYRIEALKDFSNVKKGDKGGFVESEDNLSQKGNCWIYHTAKVFDNAVICGNALISDNAVVCDNAGIHDSAAVYDDARVYGYAVVYGKAGIHNNVKVFGNARIRGWASLIDNVEVWDDASICGHAYIYGNANIYGNAHIYDDAVVGGNALVCDTTIVCGPSIIRGNAIVKEDSDYIVFKNWWGSQRFFTWTKSNNMWSVGCFYGTGKELIKKAYEVSKLSGREYKRVVDYVESILRDTADEEKFTSL